MFLEPNEKEKWADKVWGEQRYPLSTIMNKKGNWIGSIPAFILHKKCFWHNVVEGKMHVLKWLGRKTMHTTDGFCEKRKYRDWNSKLKSKKQKFGKVNKWLMVIKWTRNKRWKGIIALWCSYTMDLKQTTIYYYHSFRYIFHIHWWTLKL